MPSSYLENFKLYEQVARKIIKQPKTTYTDTAHLDDDLLKIRCFIGVQNNKTKIFLGQHGGNHRIHGEYVTNYDDDYRICNKYFVWGEPLKKRIQIFLNRLFNLTKIQSSFEKIKFDVCYVFEV